MKTLVVLDEAIVRYLLGLVRIEGGFSALRDITEHQLQTALDLLDRARRDDESK